MTRVAQQSQMPLIKHPAATDANEVTFQRDFSIANHYLNAHKLREQLRQTQEAMAMVEASNEEFNKELMRKQLGLNSAHNDITERDHSNLYNEMHNQSSHDLNLNSSQPFVGTNNKLVTMAVGSRIESFMTESLYNITTKFNHSLQHNTQDNISGAEQEKLRLVGKTLSKLNNKLTSASTQPETYAPRTQMEDNGTHNYDSDSSFEDEDIPVNQSEKTSQFGVIDSAKKYGQSVNDRSKGIKKAIVAKTTILFTQKKSLQGKVLTQKRKDLVKVQIGSGFNKLRDQTVQNMQFRFF